MLPLPDRPSRCLERLDALRAELADLAYGLERRGRRDAADVANVIAGRVGEIRAELAGAESRSTPCGEVGARSHRLGC